MNKVSFPARGDFSITLKQRIDNYFSKNNLLKTGNWRLFVKSAIALVWLAASYVLLVFFSTNLILAVISAFAVTQGFVLIGFNIMHDANHGSYSKYKLVNRIMSYTLDLIGGSSYFWKQKHNILHHTYTNITSGTFETHDDDLETGGFIRLSPQQPWRAWHRLQHWYAFPLYSLITLLWVTVNDFRKFFTRRIGEYKLRKPNTTETVFFFFAKVFYFGYTLVLPLFFHPVLYVLLAFVGIHLIVGFTLSLVFQLAHTTGDNAFPVPDTAGAIENEWAIHQVETTANFAPHSTFAAWYLGGLNFQIEHHLFSKIAHIHYPALSVIVKKTCGEFGLQYICYPSVLSALAAHFRFLKRMGKSAVT